MIVTDPEDILLYYDKGDQGAKVGCGRGSSKNEAFHRVLRTVLKGYNMTEELAAAATMDIIGVYNILVGVRNRGDPDYGTNDHRRIMRINAIEHDLCKLLSILHCFLHWCVAVILWQSYH